MSGTQLRRKHLAYLRQTYLSNRVFQTYTDILDACQDAGLRLLAEVGGIASIATPAIWAMSSVYHFEGWYK